MRKQWLTLLALAIVSLSVLLFRLEHPIFLQADEALYGRHIAQARAAEVYLYPAETDGSYTNKGVFSKPPLSIWAGVVSKELFGETLFALRLPFALGAWWTIVALCAYCLFEIRKRGIPKAVVCCALVLGAEGTLLYGRQAAIEPMLTSFCLSSVLLYAASLNEKRRARLRWLLVVGSGLFLLFAMMCKQIVGLALPLPVIAALELARRRPQRLLRFLVWCSLGIVPFLAWFLASYIWGGDGVVRNILLRTIAAGGGLRGLTHENYLNRTVYFFQQNVAPLSWWVSTVAAFFLFGGWIKRAGWAEALRRSAVFGYGAAAAGLFLIGGTGLPWYPYHLLPAAALASSLLLVDGFSLVWRAGPWRQSDGTLLVGASFVVLLSLSQNAALAFVPQLTLLALLLLLAMDVFLAGRRLSMLIAFAVCGLVFVGSRLVHPTFWERPLGLPALMASAHHAPCVSYDQSLKLRYSVERTLLGLKAHEVSPGANARDGCIAVRQGVLPEQTQPVGPRIEHAAGVFAVGAGVEPTAPDGKLWYPADRFAPGREAQRTSHGVAVKRRVRLGRDGEHATVIQGRLWLTPDVPADLTLRYRCSVPWYKRQPHRLRVSGVGKPEKRALRCSNQQLGEELSVSVPLKPGNRPKIKVTTARGGLEIVGVEVVPRP